MSEQVIKEIIGRRSFVLITGASRGFGRSLALEMGKVVGAGSTLLLMARNKDDLEVTKEIVRDARPGLAVECEVLDLAAADKEALERAVKANYGSADHEVAIVIQNAGTIGQDGRKITVKLYINSKNIRCLVYGSFPRSLRISMRCRDTTA